MRLATVCNHYALCMCMCGSLCMHSRSVYHGISCTATGGQQHMARKGGEGTRVAPLCTPITPRRCVVVCGRLRGHCDSLMCVYAVCVYRCLETIRGAVRYACIA